MAKILDTMFFSSLTFLILFLVFSATGKDVRFCAAAALAGAFSVSLIVSYLSGKRPLMFLRRRRSFSEKYVKGMLYDDAREAHNKVYRCLVKKYPVTDERFEGEYLTFRHGKNKDKVILTVVQKLKSSPDDILALWRKFGKSSGAKSMVCAVPGRSDNDVKVQAMRLTSPDVVILERMRLVRLARKYIRPEAPAKAEKRLRPMQALKGFLSKRRSFRYVLYTFLFTFNYLLTGVRFNLLFSFLFAFLSTYSMFLVFEKENLV